MFLMFVSDLDVATSNMNFNSEILFLVVNSDLLISISVLISVLIYCSETF